MLVVVSVVAVLVVLIVGVLSVVLFWSVLMWVGWFSKFTEGVRAACAKIVAVVARYGNNMGKDG